MAIALGLGLGANQVVATLVGFMTISLGLFVAGLMNKSKKTLRNTFIDVVFPNGDDAVSVADVKAGLENAGLDFEVKRVSTSGGHTEMLLDVVNFNMSEFSKTQAVLQGLNSEVEVIASQNARIIT